MQNRIPGIFPSLIGQTARRAAKILDETIAVEVGASVDPFERTVNVRQHVVHKLFVGRAVERLAQKDEPQWRGIDGSVIRAERYFAGARHLAFAEFVQDFPWLFVEP